MVSVRADSRSWLALSMNSGEAIVVVVGVVVEEES